ncbi:MAG TPA: FGGY family carbohydrate kinase [Gemmatimonadales bacterium]|nr:FGGY family carbohydrate kinase [Gemmatimonadales bacterium]
MRDLLCAIDVGTSAIKATCFRPDGTIAATSYKEHALRFPAPDRVEQDIRILDEMFDAVLRDVTGTQGDGVAAVSVTSARASFVPVDRAGEPLYPVIIWQDRRSLAECMELKERISDDDYFAITGLRLEPVAVASKAVWLRKHEPAVDAATWRYWSQQTYFLHRLGADDPPTDFTMGAYYGLLDLDHLSWSEPVLEAFGLDRGRLPKLLQAGAVVGEVSPEAAARTGLRTGTPLVLPASDAGCCWLGAGMTQPGQVAAYVGTAAGIVSYLDTPLRDPQKRLTCLPYTLPRTWTLEGLLLSAGAALKWFRDHLAPLEIEQADRLGVDAYELIEVLAASSPAGANGLLVIPTMVGAGAPYWEPNARGMILGLGLGHDRASMARAFMEGVALELRNTLEEMRRLGVPITDLTLTGGASRSALWNQIQADVQGVPVLTLETADPTALGAAICAGVGVGLFPDLLSGISSMFRSSRRYEPDLTNHDHYTATLEVYRSVLGAFADRDLHARITALAEGPKGARKEA